ncbi:MAG: hypothetical protein LH702_04765 [Phormidesmis sp. CAN_BIN44]|nr:hypothetical protein [Phormidesmis sp. CAN_BIN44]
MKVVFAALEAFDPTYGELWKSYVAWSKLTHLCEVVSHDHMLCPSIIEKLVDEDWNYLAYTDVISFPMLFSDLDYLFRRVGRTDKKFQIIATAREPEKDNLQSFCNPRFELKGFDLVDEALGTSTLTNCGGFDNAFSGSDLSECGLIRDREKALAVRRLLSMNYPEERHADCEMWGVWKMRNDT